MKQTALLLVLTHQTRNYVSQFYINKKDMMHNKKSYHQYCCRKNVINNSCILLNAPFDIFCFSNPSVK